MLPNLSASEALAAAERLRVHISNLVIALDDQSSLRLTASIGLTVCVKGSASTLGELLLKADLALYRAKAEGRNRVIAG